MKKLIVSILIIAMLAVATTPAFAAGVKPPDKPGNGHGNAFGLNKDKTPDPNETETPGKGHVKQALKAEHKNGKVAGSSNFVLFGKIVDFPTVADGASATIKVDVFSGNNLVQRAFGKQVDDEDTEDGATVVSLGTLTITVPEGARIKIFGGENEATVSWTDLAGLKKAVDENPEATFRLHGWWKAAGELTGKPTMDELKAGTWTAWQIFEINPTPEAEETEE